MHRTLITSLRRLGLALGALAAFSLASCGDSGSKPTAGGPSDAGSGPIKIGHYASMTGAEATFGVSTDNGIKLAIEEINARGGVKGRPIQLITYDNRGSLSEVTTVVTRLITRDKVVALLGEVASSRSIAGGQIAQRYGVPMVTPSSTNPDVTEIGDKIFRVCFIDPFQGDVAARFAREKGWTRAAVLYNRQQAYSTGLASNFKASFTKLGGTVVAEEAYGDGDADFGAQITTIQNAKPDVIFVPGYYTDVGAFARQVRARGVTAPLLGGDGWDSPQLATTAGDAINGSFFTNHYSHEDTSERVQQFVAAYRERFGSIPDGLAALGYDAAMILFDAMERAPSLSGADIAAALAATKDYPAVTGNITIDKNRDASKSAVVLTFVEGQQKYVTTIDPD
jgi:branched-chain amino acid transport system substrate-binding protein